MKVVPYNSMLDYLVESRSRRGHHLVDLAAHRGNGECSCEHFQFTLRPLLKLTNARPSELTRCEHIRAARRFLCDQVIRQLQAQNEENAPPTKQLTPPTRAVVIDDDPAGKLSSEALGIKPRQRKAGGGGKDLPREGRGVQTPAPVLRGVQGPEDEGPASHGRT